MMKIIPLLATLLLSSGVSGNSDSLPMILELKTPGGPLPFWVRSEIPQDHGGSITEGDLVTRPARAPQFEIYVDWRERLIPETTAYSTFMYDMAEQKVSSKIVPIVVRFPGFNSELEWGMHEDPTQEIYWKGEWRSQGRNGPRTVALNERYRESNDWYKRKLFLIDGGRPKIKTGRYTVTFSSSPDQPAVGIFDIKEDGTATGTFMTTTGDYRYLAGNAAGDTLKLSTFDGAHAFLFHAERQKDGSLKGDFWSGNWWHETWTAKFDPDAKLPDPFAQTKYQGDTASLERLDFQALDGTPTPVGVLAPSGSPRIVIVFGSWCPNCHDATRLLTEFDKTYGPRGLKILGLAFEHSSDHKKAAQSVRTFAADLNVEYPILIAGLSEKDKASDALPILDRVRSYPTTLFVDADGTIRAVHSGFTGPATGEEYTKLRARFVAHIEAMLEKAERLEMPGSDD